MTCAKRGAEHVIVQFVAPGPFNLQFLMHGRPLMGFSGAVELRLKEPAA
jgi:hypothetical protein